MVNILVILVYGMTDIEFDLNVDYGEIFLQLKLLLIVDGGMFDQYFSFD